MDSSDPYFVFRRIYLLFHLLELRSAEKDLPDFFHGQALTDGISQFLKELQFGLDFQCHVNPSILPTIYTTDRIIYSVKTTLKTPT
jgi:hypothetical protein